MFEVLGIDGAALVVCGLLGIMADLMSLSLRFYGGGDWLLGHIGAHVGGVVREDCEGLSETKEQKQASLHM